MEDHSEIKNRVAQSGLVNFDIAELIPTGQRVGIDLQDFLFQGLVLREKDFREQVAALDTEKYRESFVYIYNSADAIIPLWAYFLITSKLSGTAKKIVFGDRQFLEDTLLYDAVQNTDFSKLQDKRVLVKGCNDQIIAENAYVQLVDKLRPVVKALMYGEACSNVPILKN